MRIRTNKRAVQGLYDEFISKLFTKHDLLGCNFFGNKVIFCWHPEMAKTVLSGHYMKYPKSLRYNRLKFLLGEGLVTSEGEKWQMNRHIINPGFHAEALKNIVKIFNKHTLVQINKWIELIKSNQPSIKVNFDIDIPTLTLSIICEAAFGFQLSSLPDNKLLHSFNTIGDELINRFNDPTDWWHRLKYSRSKKTKEAMDNICTPLFDVLHKRRIQRLQMSKQDLEDNKSDPKDLVDILMNASDNENYKLSDSEIRDHAMTFFSAGFDTTSAALSWIFYELILNPNILSKCYDEVDRVFSTLSSDEVTTNGLPYHSLSQFVYLNQVIKESLRLHSPVPVLSRLSKVDTQLGDYKLPAGTVIGVIIVGIHRNPEFWEDPDSFIPDRFSAENQRKTLKHPFQYIPFSGGPRNCIGQRFSTMEILVILALILRNFNLSMDNEDIKNTRYEEILIAHLRGLNITLSPRLV